MKTGASLSCVPAWRVVVIEDSPEDRAEIRRLLLHGSDRQYQFVEAETGAAGLRAVFDASEGPPDCVVLDYNLPDADALEVLAAAIGPDGLTVCPMVVLTGSVDSRRGPVVLRAGAQDFIGKSWMSAESLTRAVENAVERWAMTRELQARTAALRVSEAQLQLAVEVAGLGVNRIDYDTHTVVLDPAAAALFGLEAGVPLPRSAVHATFHPDDKAEIVRLMNQSLDPSGEGTFSMEHRVIHPDGSTRWLNVKKQVAFGEVGGTRRPVTGVLAAVDITDRKVAEGTIARHVREMDALYATVPTGLFQFDADLRFVRVNAWTAAINGRSIEAHIGRTSGEVMDGGVARTVERLLRQVMQTGEPLLETEVHGPSGATGEECDWLTSYFPVRGAGGEVVGVHGVVQDITERIQSEAALRTSEIRFRRLFEAAEDGVLLLDGQTGRITDANPYILEALGHTRAEVRGQELWEIGVFADATASRAAMAELQTRGYVRYDDLPLESKTGQRREVEVVANVYQEDGHRVIQCNIRDVTERKKLQDELKRSADELQKFASALSEADRRKDEFLATLAHELRNPLAPIRNGLEVIKRSGANGAVEQARAMMERQVTQLVRLVDDLLDISRVTQGKLQLRRERLEVRAVLDAALETSRPPIEQAGHELTVAVPDEPIFVDGDATRLAQVVSNLLTNSAKYTHRGGHVRLTVRRDGDAVVVSVADDGIGIPPTMLDKVFVMFTQVDRTLEKTTGGLGIGLSLVKGLVEMHGGTIEARSEGEGKGSEFVVRLPVAVSTAGGPQAASQGAEEVVPSGLRRILVVDDNVDAADSLAQLLELLGNEVRTAYDGGAGVAAAEAFRPDLILMDIGMPKVNGYEACRRVREQPWGATVVLVALTGWGQDDDRRKSAEAGFDHHLVKPIAFAALTKLLAGLEKATA